MPYQIDVLCVGDKSHSGDAIALRFGDLQRPEETTVVVIDGGFQSSGKDLVQHIQTHYKTTKADLVISTHPDRDHSSGLACVLENMTVGALWMHRPWNHTTNISEMFVDGRLTDSSVTQGIRESLQDVRDVETIAARRGIGITEPFVGLTHADRFGNRLTVLSPTIEFYRLQLLNFRCTPKPRSLASIFETVAGPVKSAVANCLEEAWDIETLREPSGTHAENESSVVLLFESGDKKVLFTADAGPNALALALDTLQTLGVATSQLSLIQVPHHGSRRNVGPLLLDRLLGPIQATDLKLRVAVVSACPDGAPKHPSKQVTNAFRRRGAPVWGASGRTILFNDCAPRDGWSSADSIPLQPQVEPYED